MIYGSWPELRNAIEMIKGDFYLAGAGNLGIIFGEYLNRKDIPWNGYLDKKKFPSKVCEKEVYSYESISGRKDCSVLVSSSVFSKEIHQMLLKQGIPEMNILMPVDHDTRAVLDLMDEMYHVYDFLPRLKTFHNKHRGKRCFVIGNGPSLKIADLEKLGNEISFASNSIFALYAYTAWRPTYYAVSDTSGIKTFQKGEIRRRILDCDAVFTPIISWIYLKNCEDSLDNIFYFRASEGIDCKNRKAFFSEDVCQRMYGAGTVTYYLLQLAVYMGFTEIYLLGMDFAFTIEKSMDGKVVKNDVSNHNRIIENTHKKLYDFQYFVDIDSQLFGYQAAKRYADAHGIKIYNATRGGRLEVFERVDFDSLFR